MSALPISIAKPVQNFFAASRHLKIGGAVVLATVFLSSFTSTISQADFHENAESDPQADSSSKKLTRPQFEELFKNSIDSFTSANSDELKIKNLIQNNIQDAYNQFDLSKFELILSEKFEYRRWQKPGTAAVEPRELFLEARKFWPGHKGTPRQLHYSNTKMVSDSSRQKITVFLASTYESKYFSPKFLETLAFVKHDGLWLLERQVLYPLYPELADHYDVQIFIADRQWPKHGRRSLQQRYPITTKEKGPDYLIDLHREKSRARGYPGDEVERTVLLVFREPPPIGSAIEVEHQYWRPWAQNLRPFKFTYRIENSDPYLLIENRTAAGGSGGTITYTVRLDGKKIAKRTIQIF